LPEVDEKGRAEFPFTNPEETYAIKEEAANDVVEHLKILRKDLGSLNKEIAICIENLELIRADATHLHLDHTIQDYDFAEGSLEGHYKKAIDQREALIDLIALVEKKLDLAETKNWPLGEPKKRPFMSGFQLGGPFGFRDYATSGPGLFSPSPPSVSLRTELDSLMALGPIGRDLFGQSPFQIRPRRL